MLLFDILGKLLWVIPVVGLVAIVLVYCLSGAGENGKEKRRTKVYRAVITLWIVSTAMQVVGIARYCVVVREQENLLNEMAAVYQEFMDQQIGGSNVKPAMVNTTEMERHFNLCNMFCPVEYPCPDVVTLQTNRDNEVISICGRKPLVKDGAPYGLSAKPLTGEKLEPEVRA